MTTIIVVLIGIGVVFIASSLDCSPIRDTFTKIVTNQAVDWSGTQNCQPASTPPPSTGGTQGLPNIPAVPLPKSGKCPQGYIWHPVDKVCYPAVPVGR